MFLGSRKAFVQEDFKSRCLKRRAGMVNGERAKTKTEADFLCFWALGENFQKKILRAGASNVERAWSTASAPRIRLIFFKMFLGSRKQFFQEDFKSRCLERRAGMVNGERAKDKTEADFLCFWALENHFS
jgi:hypothetical protein